MFLPFFANGLLLQIQEYFDRVVTLGEGCGPTVLGFGFGCRVVGLPLFTSPPDPLPGYCISEPAGIDGPVPRADPHVKQLCRTGQHPPMLHTMQVWHILSRASIHTQAHPDRHKGGNRGV